MLLALDIIATVLMGLCAFVGFGYSIEEESLFGFLTTATITAVVICAIWLN